MEELLKEYHKRFADGEQHIKLKLANKTIEKDNDEYYYWQERGIFNHIKPLLDLYAKDLSEEQIYGKSGLVSLLIPSQLAYNAVKNRELEYINRCSMGILCVEDGSINVDDLCEEGLTPGKIIVYRQGSKAPCQLLTHMDTEPYINSAKALYEEMVTITKMFVEAHKEK